MRKNCSSGRVKLLQMQGCRPRTCKFFDITQTTYSKSNVKRTIFEAEHFLSGFWSFQRSNTLQQLKCLLEQMIRMQNQQKKVRKSLFLQQNTLIF